MPTVTSDDSFDLEALFLPEPIRLEFGDSFAQAATCIRAAFHLAGAENTSSASGDASVVSIDRFSALSTSGLDELRRTATVKPVLIAPTAAAAALDARALKAINCIAGTDVRVLDPARASAFTFTQADNLWPFAGVTLREAAERTLAAVDPWSRAVEPLVTTERGAVFLKLGPGRLYLTLVPIADVSHNGLVKHEIDGARFMGLLPLMFFLRIALGERAWRQSSASAAFMVDDVNLRFTRYGFLRLRRLIAAAREQPFHTSLAMIPLDYRKTRASVAELVRRNPDLLSIVLHGVDHLRGEFSTEVPFEFAESTLLQGLLRMEAHERATAIVHARAVTFPHGLCNATWMRAMRSVGFDAAIASRSFPFRPEWEISDPLYELHPAETAFYGFPVVNRFRAEEPKEKLLFKAFLGKPLIIYTHHSFFNEGLDPVLEIAEFLNRQVSPKWTSVDTILRSNYQVKRVGRDIALRAFSNRIFVPAKEDYTVQVVLKRGANIPTDEACWLDSTLMRPRRLAEGVAAVVGGQRQGDFEVSFGPARRPDFGALRQPALSSRCRRFATELRDQAVMPASARLHRARRRDRSSPQETTRSTAP
jgi:hypothetical protein